MYRFESKSGTIRWDAFETKVHIKGNLSVNELDNLILMLQQARGDRENPLTGNPLADEPTPLDRLRLRLEALESRVFSKEKDDEVHNQGRPDHGSGRTAGLPDSSGDEGLPGEGQVHMQGRDDSDRQGGEAPHGSTLQEGWGDYWWEGAYSSEPAVFLADPTHQEPPPGWTLIGRLKDPQLSREEITLSYRPAADLEQAHSKKTE